MTRRFLFALLAPQQHHHQFVCRGVCGTYGEFKHLELAGSDVAERLKQIEEQIREIKLLLARRA